MAPANSEVAADAASTSYRSRGEDQVGGGVRSLLAAPAGEPVRITADREGQRWESSAEFTADGAGRVDTTSAASTGGTYRGLDPHGLFWSMRLATPEQLAAARIPVERIAGPVLLTSGGDDGI